MNGILPGRKKDRYEQKQKEVSLAFTIHKGVETQDLEARQNIIRQARLKADQRMREKNTRLVAIQPVRAKELTRFEIFDKKIIAKP